MIESKPHNPRCRLVETTIPTVFGYLNVVYGELNEGTDKGVEVYYHKKDDPHHYYSRRWALADVPKDYGCTVNMLKNLVKDCPAGHKIKV